jgi:hypothetical protein
LIRPQFRAAFAPASKPLIASRWYATEPESKEAAKDEAAAPEGKGKEAEAGAEDSAKELEAKNKEIIELKVCLLLPTPTLILRSAPSNIRFFIGQISALSTRLQKPSGADEA